MSSLIGAPHERWPLARAIDALGEAARQAGRPGLVWLAGIFYPAIGIGAGGGWTFPGLNVWVTRDGQDLSWGAAQLGLLLDRLVQECAMLFALPFVAVLFLPLFRLVAGLARTGTQSAWREAGLGHRTPPLRTLWRAGQGLTFSTYGLWLQLVLMQLAALFVLFLPVAAIVMHVVQRPDDAATTGLVLFGALMSPLVLVLALYLLALSVLGQLGLQSLAANRRGVSSALLHAWRIARNDPWATTRAVLAELVLLCVTLLAIRAFGGLVRDVPGDQVMTIAFQVALAGFAGVVRAAYWARAFRALGGLTPDDRMPGLVSG